MLFGQPQTWVASLVEALQADARGDVDLAAKLRSDALAAAPATAGTLDETPFEWIADADSRLGPVLEAVRQRTLRLGAVRAPRAREHRGAGRPARPGLGAGAISSWPTAARRSALLPSRYAGSGGEGDGALQLSRKTEWIEIGPDQYRGLGQRILTTSDPRTRPAGGARSRPACSACGGLNPAMAVDVRNRLQPALLDRLTDDEPEQRQETESHRVMSKTQLRQAVLRDLGALFNSVQPLGSEAEPYPLLAESVLNFGLPSLSGQLASSSTSAGSRTRSARRSCASSRASWPTRCRSTALEATNVLDTHNVIEFEIRGHLWSQPVPLEILLRTQLDLEAGQIEMRDVAGVVPSKAR